METMYPWIIAGCIFAIILIVGLYPKRPQHPRNGRNRHRKIERAAKATLPEFYQKTYKESSSTTLSNEVLGEIAREDIKAVLGEDKLTEIIIGPGGIIEFDPTEKEESDYKKIFKPWPDDVKSKLKRKLDI